MRESKLETQLREGIEALGGEALKIHRRGWPDRLVILPSGRTIWVEMKTPYGRLSGMQKLVHSKLISLHQIVLVLNSANLVDNFLKENS